jgi:hypothetical protein
MADTVVDFFDVNNLEHLKAYKMLIETGVFGDGNFKRQHLKLLGYWSEGWQVGIANKIAKAYINEKIK